MRQDPRRDQEPDSGGRTGPVVVNLEGSEEVAIGFDKTAKWYDKEPLAERLSASFGERAKKMGSADEKAAAWIDAQIEMEGIARDALTKADWFLLTKMVPCQIRCWRVGFAVDVEPGEPCPECGKVRPVQTAWDRLMEAV